MKLTKKILAATVAGIIAAVPAIAQDLRVAPAAPPAHPAHYMYEKLSEYLASDAEMGTTILGPEVVALPQIADALNTGLVDVGNALPLYFAADFPTTGIAGDLALEGRDPHAMGLAMTEWVLNCPACLEEFSEFGGVFLGSGSTDVYGLITTTPVNSPDDLRGLRLRTGGAPFTRFAEHFGATGVQMAVGDTFEALSQGTIDGTVTSLVDMLSYRLVDVATHYNTLPVGTYHALSNFTVASPTWERMSVEERTALARAANRANFDLTDRWAFQLPAAAREAVDASDIVVTEPSAELIAATEAFAKMDSAAQIEKSGEFASDFLALVDAWALAVEGIDNDTEALAALAWDRIWSKLDFSTYGL